MEAGELIEVRLTVQLPKAATAQEVDAWLKFHLGANGAMSMAHPLIDHDVEVWGAFGAFAWDATGQIGVREEFNHQDMGNGKRQCSVRYFRTPADASATADRPKAVTSNPTVDASTKED